MIRNYLKIGFRNLQRNKAYTLINVLGLALGMTCGILIFNLITYHLSFDNFHTNSDRIYRIVTEQHRDNIDYTSSVPSPLGKALRNDYTFGEKIARIATYEDQLISINNGKDLNKFKEAEGVAFTEAEFFDIFNYPLILGDKKTALSEPNTAIITERLAKKYFGNDNPINKTFLLDSRINFKVTGVLKDLPINTDRRTDIYLSYSTLKAYDEWMASDDAWGGINSSMQCFVLLREGISAAQVEKVMPAYVKKYRPKSKNVHHYKLQPLSDVHYNAQYGGAMDKKNLWVLSFIGFFLIITACVNFINLATAQALNRSKEVGVRKVLGSLRGQLFWQFIAETGLITLMAVIISIGLAWLVLPFMNDWFKSQITLRLFSDWKLLVFMPLLAVAVTFFAGSYPGLILAGFQPIAALKSKLSQRNIGGFNTRRTLIIAQFAISQILIIGMIVIAKQMQYSKQTDLGFNKDAVVMVPIGSGTNVTRMNTIKSRLSGIKGVENVSLCFSAPSSSNSWNSSLRYESRTEDETFKISIKAADNQYLSLFDLKLVAGRNLFPSDTVKEFLATEMLAKKLNLKSSEELIGKKITINGNVKAPIVGVIKDFHDESLHEDLKAICIPSWAERYNSYAVKINLSEVNSTLTALEKTWSEMHPEQMYSYQFLDEHIAEFYQVEELMLKMIQVFSFIAIFIGCLGLYGLVSFMATQKTKEIGIRKVLGGSVSSIIWIFGKEFARLIIIAFIVAAPIGWRLMNSWLNTFKFHIPINAWVFVLAILSTFIVASLTVGYQTIKAALMNPVKSLKTE